METSETQIVGVWERLLSLFRPREGSLYTPAADVLMAGGASIIAFIVIYLFVDKSTNIATWSIAVYYAAFFVNYPHFTSSYQLIYGDAKGSFMDFKGNRKFALKLWWAGIVVPLILLGFFLYALLTDNAHYVGYLANAMFFFVGWHYIKQIYGCVIVLSSAKRVYYKWYERWSVLVPLYALWAISFINANLYGGTNTYYQIVYSAAKIPEWYLNASYTVLALATFVMVAVLVRKFTSERRVPPVAAMVALLSIYIWYVPALTHPFYVYIIPFFHSLQYLLFVAAYERNLTVSQSALVGKKELRELEFSNITGLGSRLFLVLPFLVLFVTLLWNPPASIDYLMVIWYGTLAAVPPLLWLKTTVVLFVAGFLFLSVRRKAARDVSWRFTSFFVSAFMLGVLLFAVLPTVFDISVRNHLLPGNLNYDYQKYGVSLYLYFFTILINVHHYFIDNVIWKSNNPHIRTYLFAPKA